MTNFTDLSSRLRPALAAAIISLGMLGGCASTGDPRDPLEPLNRGIYKFNDGVDTVLIRPAAEIYKGVLPPLVRTGVSNVFSNLNDVVVALNNLLQGKFEAALSDAGRVLINTTAGLLGIFDVATEAGLEKHDEDFGQTLGWWGIGDGPYLVLPFLGPRNLRDTAGTFADYQFDPVSYIDPSRDRNIVQGTRIISRRAELLGASRILEVAAIDEYEFVRDAYLQRRRNLIYDGNPPREKDEGAGMAPRDGILEARGVNRRAGGTGIDRQTFWSGTPPTPAEEEALQKQPAAPSAVAAPARRVAAAGTAAQPVVRVWLPNPR
ncbi:MAG: VacJ family lipoprotein [Burkholderiales bacterium]